MFFSPGAVSYGYIDVTIVHEINHAIETFLVGKDAEGNLLYKSGFEYLSLNNNKIEILKFFLKILIN